MPNTKRRKDGFTAVLDPNVCVLCNVPDDSEEVYGKLIKKCDLTIHYFCMLFSSALSQGGKSEEEGIFGFMPDDIMKEVRRGTRLRCTFCKQKGATIGCVVGACRKVFHFGCGKAGGTLHQYYDSYRSFCEEHRPRQMVSVSDRLAFYGTASTTCAICMTSVETRASNETLRSPCCRNSWFHRSCIVKHALTAGLYFFKCPLCNNKEIFQEEMLKFGVYLPDQDAAWEREPDAFHDLLERYLHCDARLCHCQKGRDYNQDGQKWEIIVCNWCGSQGSHIGCRSLTKIGGDDVCIECKAMHIDKTKGKQKALKKGKSPKSSQKEIVDLDKKAKSEYPGKSDRLVKKGLPSTLSATSLLSPSHTVSPGTVLRLSYEETDDDVDVVDSMDSQPSTSQECQTTPTRKRKHSAQNTQGKRRKLCESKYVQSDSNQVSDSEPLSLTKGCTLLVDTATHSILPKVKQSHVRQSALSLQAKRKRKSTRRTRSIGLSLAESMRLERLGTPQLSNQCKTLKRAHSVNCGTECSKKAKAPRDPWSHCKGFAKRRVRKHRSLKGQYPTEILSTDTSVAEESSEELVPGEARKSILRTILTSSTDSVECSMSQTKPSGGPVNVISGKLLNGPINGISGKHLNRPVNGISGKHKNLSQKPKTKKISKLSLGSGQRSILSWLTGSNGRNEEHNSHNERGDIENNINVLNQVHEMPSDPEEAKNLVIKYQGKKFIVKKERCTQIEKSDSPSDSKAILQNCVPKETSDSEIKSECVLDKTGSSPALCTRRALLERRSETIITRRRISTPRTFPRRAASSKCKANRRPDLANVYGTPRRSARCSLKFEDTYDIRSDANVKSEDYDSSSTVSYNYMPDLVVQSPAKRVQSPAKHVQCPAKRDNCVDKPEEEIYCCLIVDLTKDHTGLEEPSKADHGKLCGMSPQHEDVVEIDSSDSCEQDTYIIQSFGGSHGFQQLSISVPSV